jgi:hypothetical protein
MSLRCYARKPTIRVLEVLSWMDAPSPA